MDGRLSFLLFDPRELDELLTALGLAWRQRSFAPCADLCRRTQPRAHDFARRCHLDEEPLLCQIPSGLRFTRDIWRYVVGEALWICAAEIPELETCPQTLTCLLAPEWLGQPISSRVALPPILRAHHGSREVTLGGSLYCPKQTGINVAAEVAELRDYLESVNPSLWAPEQLALLPDLPAEERVEELALARDWFEPLREVYRTAAGRQNVVVCEVL